MVALTARLVDREDPTRIRWDFDDATGTNNPGNLRTILTDIDLGAVEAPLDVIKPRGSGAPTRAGADPQPRVVTFGVDAWAPDGLLSTLSSAVDVLYRFLSSEDADDRLIALDDGAGVRFLEPLGIERMTPDLRSSALLPAVAQGEDGHIAFEILCRPYLVSNELLSDDNLLANATLGVEGATANRPDGWAWDSTSNISFEDLGGQWDAYRVQSATASARNLQQTTPVGSAAPNERHVFAFKARAATTGIYNAVAAFQYADAAGTLLGSESASAVVAITTAEQRVYVVGGVAPANTSRVRVSIRITNPTAGPVGLYLRDAALTLGTSLPTFIAGNHTVDADASEPYGLAFPLVVEGTAPTGVTFDIAGTSSPAPSKLTSLVIAARGNNGVDGDGRILEYLNADTRWVPGGTSVGGWSVTTEGGAAVSDADAFASNGYSLSIPDAATGVRLRRWRAVRTTNLDALRGEWMVYGRFDPRESDIEWQLQLQYGAANVDPVPYANEATVLEVERTGDTSDAGLTPYVYWPLGVMRIPETGSIGAVRVELWAGRRNDFSSGGATLRFGGLLLVPYAPRTAITVPGVGKVEWSGSEFRTPTLKLATDPGASLFANGDFLDGGGVVLDQPNEAMGVRPDTGQAYGTGRARLVFDVSRVDQHPRFADGPSDLYLRVVRVSPSQAVVKQRRIKKPGRWALEFDAVAGETYIPQAVHRDIANRRLTISTITKHFLPYVAGANAERVVADPEAQEVTKRDSSRNVQAYLDVAGQTPFVLEPGRYVVVIVPGEVSQPGHPADDAPLARTYVVRTRYSPRWTQ